MTVLFLEDLPEAELVDVNRCAECDRIIGGEQPFCSHECAARYKAEADL